MLESGAFREQVETTFRANYQGGAVSLRLVSITGGPVEGGGEQFSLFFHGPATAALPQGTYTLEHDALGSLALFIVPIVGSNQQRIVYEACFTRLGPPAASAATSSMVSR
jgi:hypothetical protein